MYQLYNNYIQYSTEITATNNNPWINFQSEKMFTLNLGEKSDCLLKVLDAVYKKMCKYICLDSFDKKNIYQFNINEFILLTSQMHNCQILELEPQGDVYQLSYEIKLDRIKIFLNIISLYESCSTLEEKTKIILIMVGVLYSHNKLSNYIDINGLLYQYLLGLLHSLEETQFDKYHENIIELLATNNGDIFLLKFDTSEDNNENSIEFSEQFNNNHKSFFAFDPISRKLLMNCDTFNDLLNDQAIAKMNQLSRVYNEYNTGGEYDTGGKYIKGYEHWKQKFYEAKSIQDHNDAINEFLTYINTLVDCDDCYIAIFGCVSVDEMDLFTKNNFTALLCKPKKHSKNLLENNISECTNNIKYICKEIEQFIIKNDLLDKDKKITIYRYLEYIIYHSQYKNTVYSNSNIEYIEKIINIINEYSVTDIIKEKLEKLKQLAIKSKELVKKYNYNATLNLGTEDIFNQTKVRKYAKKPVDKITTIKAQQVDLYQLYKDNIEPNQECISQDAFNKNIMRSSFENKLNDYNNKKKMKISEQKSYELSKVAQQEYKKIQSNLQNKKLIEGAQQETLEMNKFQENKTKKSNNYIYVISFFAILLCFSLIMAIKKKNCSKKKINQVKKG